MKADLSRDTFDPVKHFLRVIQQQGRVVLDADMNEQAAILIRYIQRLAADLIGPFGGPAAGAGFRLAVFDDVLYINPGRYYVDGILCELELGRPIEEQEVLEALEKAGMSPHAVPYDEQPDQRLEEGENPLPQDERLVYLDVWEHHVTAIEDPSIRDVALGGPDTSTRSRVVCQVKLAEPPEGTDLNLESCARIREVWPEWVGHLQPAERGRLMAKDDRARAATDPGITPPMAGHRGAENQLYRVEIRASGPASRVAARHLPVATFVWSRENGSVLSGWIETSNQIVLADPGRYARLGYAAGDWIELTDDARELKGEPGTLVKVTNVEDHALTIDKDTADGPTDPASFADNPKIRRWDSDGALPVVIPPTNGGWIHLEDGVAIKFSADFGNYRSGDYWLIPARVLGGVEWPLENGRPAMRPPRGVAHHYAPLGILRGRDASDQNRVESCLCTFDPLE